jgi:hypothetical protein
MRVVWDFAILEYQLQSGLELNRQQGGPFRNGTAPSANTFRACYKNIRPVLESAGPIDASGAFRISVTSPGIIFFGMGPQKAV